MKVARFLPLAAAFCVACDTSSATKVTGGIAADCTLISVTVSPASVGMFVGDSAQLTAKTPPPPCGSGSGSGAFLWRSSNIAVATVDSAGGKVHAVAVGSATIIALALSDTVVKGAAAITVNSR